MGDGRDRKNGDVNEGTYSVKSWPTIFVVSCVLAVVLSPLIKHFFYTPTNKIKVVSEEHDDWNGDPATLETNRNEMYGINEEIEASRLTVWIDPLDATKEYTENLLEYVTVMVGVAVDGVPAGGLIHRPFANETVWSWRSWRSPSLENCAAAAHQTGHDKHRIIVSRSHAGKVHSQLHSVLPDSVVSPAGGAGYKVWEVVCGRQDAYIHSTFIKKWDLCAGDAILRSLGGRLTNLKGEDLDYSKGQDYKNEGGVIGTLSSIQTYVDVFKSLG